MSRPPLSRRKTPALGSRRVPTLRAGRVWRPVGNRVSISPRRNTIPISSAERLRRANRPGQWNDRSRRPTTQGRAVERPLSAEKQHAQKVRRRWIGGSIAAGILSLIGLGYFLTRPPAPVKTVPVSVIEAPHSNAPKKVIPSVEELVPRPEKPAPAGKGTDLIEMPTIRPEHWPKPVPLEERPKRNVKELREDILLIANSLGIKGFKYGNAVYEKQPGGPLLTDKWKEAALPGHLVQFIDPFQNRVHYGIVLGKANNSVYLLDEAGLPVPQELLPRLMVQSIYPPAN